MRYAIFSDIHSNLDAFQVVMESISLKNVDKRVFLGDIVGYGADPNECIDLLKGSADIMVAGNHDHAAIGLTSSQYFNPKAKLAIDWTKSVLTNENKTFLKELPLLFSDEHITFVHSSPKEPGLWHYIQKMSAAVENFKYFNTQICFIGHSHYPIILEESPDGKISRKKEDLFAIESDSKYIINDGSVGQPRDGNPDSSYCIYDSSAKEVELIRVPYDVEAQQNKMRKANLPDKLIDRIAFGR